MEANHLPAKTELIWHCSDFTVEAGKEATRQLLSRQERPDAIFGITDDLAIGAIEAIKEKDLTSRKTLPLSVSPTRNAHAT